MPVVMAITTITPTTEVIMVVVIAITTMALDTATVMVMATVIPMVMAIVIAILTVLMDHTIAVIILVKENKELHIIYTGWYKSSVKTFKPTSYILLKQKHLIVQRG